MPRESGRDLQTDRSVAIPLAWANKGETPVVRVAAVIHLYYDELALEIRTYLESVEEGVDVYISTGNDYQAGLIRTAFSGWSKGNVDVRVVPNIGRDIAPKLIAFKDVYPRYEYVVLLHGKRSTHASVLAPWRQFMLESLLGTPKIVASVLAIFDSQPKIGIVAPQHFEPVRRWLGWGANFAGSQLLAQRMGFSLDPQRPLDFPSGSMFWARAAALKPLLDLGLQFEDFDPEQGQQDGTLAHAIEHLFFFACQRAGYDWVKVGQPELYEGTPGIEHLSEPRELAAWIDANRYELIAPYAKTEPWSRSQQVPGPSAAFFARIRQRALGATGRGLDAGICVAVGIPPAVNARQMSNGISAAAQALDLGGSGGHFVLVGCDHEVEEVRAGVRYVRVAPSESPARIHNELMANAFASGATHYVAMAAGVLPHRSAIAAMLATSAANRHRALVEGVPAVQRGPIPYDSLGFDLVDLRCDFLLIPCAAHAELGGFDEGFSADIVGVDFGWRARACGFVLKACPIAFFADDPQPQAADVRALLGSVKRLLQKWDGPVWLAQRIADLASRGGLELPAEISAKRVPDEWIPYADFEKSFVRQAVAERDQHR